MTRDVTIESNRDGGGYPWQRWWAWSHVPIDQAHHYPARWGVTVRSARRKVQRDIRAALTWGTDE